jgi:hypothetical protein
VKGGQHLLEAHGIKSRCYWELFEEHVRNLGTLCFDHPSLPKKRKTKKKTLHGKLKLHSPHQTQLEKKTPHSPPQDKKGRSLHYMKPLLIGCMEILFLNLAAIISGLD